MRLSVIIPFYNSEKFLPKCLDSLMNQGIDTCEFEILIINDGSTDRSLNVVLEYASKYPNIIMHTKPNGGVGSARNKGLSLAKGDYIYFIDPDDYLADDVLEKILKTAEHNALDILTFSSRETKKSDLNQSDKPIDNVPLSDVTNGIDYIANYRFKNEVWWYVIKKSLMDVTKIRFIEDRWMEDAILTAELFLQADRIAYWPIDAHRHLIVKGSAMKSKEPSHYLKVIDDKKNAALVYDSLINDLILQRANPKCIKRLRTRQQSFVFFMMVRMLKSTISLDKVKTKMDKLSTTKAYPMDNFVGNDYSGLRYSLLTKLFNNKRIFYLLFTICNPILK